MKKKTKSDNISRIIILVICITVIMVGVIRFAYFFHDELSVYYVKDINATFEIGKGAGFSIDTNVLNFGRITPGGSSTKEIILYHEYKEPLKVKIVYLGNISKVLSPKESLILEPKTEKKITLIANANTNKFGKYEGIVRILYIKT